MSACLSRVAGERIEPVYVGVRAFRARVREGKPFIYRCLRWFLVSYFSVIAFRIY